MSVTDRIRAAPNIYLGKNPRYEALVSRLADDALFFGASDVQVKRLGTWWVVISDKDWLCDEGGSIIFDEFYQLIPIPGGEYFRDRVLVIINSFSSSLITKGRDGIKCICGCDTAIPHDVEMLLDNCSNLYRAFAFSLIDFDAM